MDTDRKSESRRVFEAFAYAGSWKISSALEFYCFVVVIGEWFGHDSALNMCVSNHDAQERCRKI